jgi:O-antigen ligase
MRLVTAAITFLVPLALTPGLLFYYDITPKDVLILLGAAVLALFAAGNFSLIQRLRLSRRGRWYVGLVAGMIVMPALAALSSPLAAMAWNGSNLRRWGAITEMATLAIAFLIALGVGSSRSGRRLLLRCWCVAGVVASAYGILQYFGWDPIIPAYLYQVGEGSFQIVRPPATLGHSDYFAAFLLWPVFSGIGLWCSDKGPSRWLGAVSAMLCVAAMVLSGSRGALLGLGAGACMLLYFRRVPVRTLALTFGAMAIAAGAFTVSPAGARLRARAFWISEDPAGGARPLLWRDSLRMAAGRPWLGYGPDTFVAAFPRFQSRELSRAYPDFFHESPHNMLLDSLTGDGLVALIMLLALIGLGFFAGRRAAKQDVEGAALVAALTGTVAAHQFVVLIAPTALALYTGIGLLVQLAQPREKEAVAPARNPPLWIASCALVAAGLMIFGARIALADAALQRVARSIQLRDANGAAQAYQSAQKWRATGLTADLPLSRRAAEASASELTLPDKAIFARIALAASRQATQIPEQRQNAWYNLAVLEASGENPAVVEASLRAAIAEGPYWFKPHWMLARVLKLRGNVDEARREAVLALDLNAGKDREVKATLGDLLRSAGPPR